MGEPMLPLGLSDHRAKVVEALTGVVDLWIAAQHIASLVHETGCVELAPDVHTYHQRMLPDP